MSAPPRARSWLDPRSQLAAHPYRTLLVAAGAGYILGGGLFTKLTFQALRAGARMGALPLIQRELFNALEHGLAATNGVPAPARSQLPDFTATRTP